MRRRWTPVARSSQLFFSIKLLALIISTLCNAAPALSGEPRKIVLREIFKSETASSKSPFTRLDVFPASPSPSPSFPSFPSSSHAFAPSPSPRPTLRREPLSYAMSGSRDDEEHVSGQETRAQGVHVTGADLKAEAGHHHHGGHHGYFQYSRVPHKGAWEFGFRRGNPHHFKERHEHGHGAHFKTKVRWGDKHGGYGEHYWDYNHHGPKHHEHGHKHHAAAASK